MFEQEKQQLDDAIAAYGAATGASQKNITGLTNAAHRLIDEGIPEDWLEEAIPNAFDAAEANESDDNAL